MSPESVSGYLVLADISGYSSYLASTELEHSPQVLAELLELIVHHLVPPLQLSKLEGDAVFAHAPEAMFSRGETLMELIEESYVSFRDRIRAIERNMCDCAACRRTPTLDLKFVVHHGRYRIHRVAGNDELVGTDVALAHRLLKNRVGEATGWRGYSLFTRPSLERLGLRPEGLHVGSESYDLGVVETESLDLNARYLAFVEARTVVVSPEEADIALARDLPGPPALVWEWLNDPVRRLRWEELVVDPKVLPGGRSGAGEVSHCLQDGDVVVMTVLDWRPFDYFTVESTRASRDGGTLTTYRLTPTDGGTTLHVSTAMRGTGLLRRRARRSEQLRLRRALDRLAEAISEGPGTPALAGSAPGGHNRFA
jgi:hypothetical protein